MKKSNNTPRPRHHDYNREAQSIIDGTHAGALCTPNAAALVLNVTPKHVRCLIHDGTLKGVQLGRALRANVSAVRILAGLEG